jgi:hypothetical protein
MTSGEIGAVMVATGKKSLREAELSAKSLKKHNKNVPILIATDVPYNGKIFDEVMEVSSTPTQISHRILRISTLKQTPFDRTLYLDSDTFVCANITSLFQLLEHFDIAANVMHSPYAHDNKCDTFESSIPKSFPWVNAGVLVYKDSESIDNLFSRWLQMYKKYATPKYAQDQLFLREALYNSTARLCPLTDKYNCVPRLSGSLWGELKILHAAGMSHDQTMRLPSLAKELQRAWQNTDELGVIYSGTRIGNNGKIFWFKNSFLKKHYSSPYPIPGKIGEAANQTRQIYKKEGLLEVLKYLKSRVKSYFR